MTAREDLMVAEVTLEPAGAGRQKFTNYSGYSCSSGNSSHCGGVDQNASAIDNLFT